MEKTEGQHEVPLACVELTVPSLFLYGFEPLDRFVPVVSGPYLS